jgi:hypothetical protein
MDLAMISPAHPNMLLLGQLRRCKARWMWRCKLRKFVKFGQGAREGGFATSAAASPYEITLSILLLGIPCTGGRFDCLLSSLRTVDCSKGAIAVSLVQKVVLSFNGYWGKRSEYSLAKTLECYLV